MHIALFFVQFGDIVSLNLAGVEMTFLFEPSHIDYFFSAPDEKITFRSGDLCTSSAVWGFISAFAEA